MSAYKTEVLVDKNFVRPKEEFHILALISSKNPNLSAFSRLFYYYELGRGRPPIAYICRSQAVIESLQPNLTAEPAVEIESVPLKNTRFAERYIGTARLNDYGCFNIRVKASPKEATESETVVAVADTEYVKKTIASELFEENIREQVKHNFSLSPSRSLHEVVLEATREVESEINCGPRRNITIDVSDVTNQEIHVEPVRSSIKWLLKLFCEAIVWKGNVTISGHIENDTMSLDALLHREPGLELASISSILQLRLPEMNVERSFYRREIIYGEKPNFAKIRVNFPAG
jgi:hypothetical protein